MVQLPLPSVPPSNSAPQHQLKPVQHQPPLLNPSVLKPKLPLKRRAVVPDSSARWPALLRKLPHHHHNLSNPSIHTSYSGVAVGSSIGHAVGGWFGGGSSAPTEQDAAPMASAQDNGMYQSSGMANANAQQGVCANDINNFRQCMDQNQGSLTICGWYLDQLKACQQAASQY